MARYAGVAVVDHRAHQDLPDETGDAAVAGEQGRPGGEAASRAASRDKQTVAVDAEIRGIFVDPLECGKAVLDRDRDGVLGSQAVLDGHDDPVEVGGPRQYLVDTDKAAAGSIAPAEGGGEPSAL